MIAQPPPLIEVFAEIPDFRHRRGKRHPLPAMLSLACCAMLCGYRSYSAIAEWGYNYGTRIAQALGFTHNPPCAPTLHTVFRHVDRDLGFYHLSRFRCSDLGCWVYDENTLPSPPRSEYRPSVPCGGSCAESDPPLAIGHRLLHWCRPDCYDDRSPRPNQRQPGPRCLALR